MRERFYRIGELARVAGVSQRTIDYYTRLGLLKPMKRTEGNYRIYCENARQRLQLIKAMQAQRMPLAEIRTKLDGCPLEAGSEIVEKVRTIGEELAGVERQLATLGAVAANVADVALRRSLARTAREALVHSLILAQYLAALAGEGLPNL